MLPRRVTTDPAISLLARRFLEKMVKGEKVGRRTRDSTPNYISLIISTIQITSHILFQQSKLHLTYYFSNPNYISLIISAIQITSHILFQQSKLHLTYYFSNPNYISLIISAIQITSHILFQQSKLHLTY